MSSSRVRVYIACSLDGFIAGPDGDLSWLPGADPDEADSPPASEAGGLGFEAFMDDVGALLMGRATYDAVRGFGVPWPYGDRPVLVASSRGLDEDPPATVRRVEGPIDALIADAVEAAGGRDVYLDGGAMIRQALEAGAVDELTVTFAPIALGQGVSLFGGLHARVPLSIVSQCRFAGGMAQLRLVPDRG